MGSAIVSFFTSFPPIIGTLLMAVIPFVERFALPVAIAGYHLPVWEALILVITGNMIPIVVILLFVEKFHNWVSAHSGLFGQAWVKALAHAQKKFVRYEKFGLIGLMLFMSIPLPINGAFTGALIAFILGVPMRKALPYLFLGVTISAFLAAGLTVGIDKLF